MRYMKMGETKKVKKFFRLLSKEQPVKKELLNKIAMYEMVDVSIATDILCMVSVLVGDTMELYYVSDWEDAFNIFYHLKERSIKNRMTPTMVETELNRMLQYKELGPNYPNNKYGMKAYLEFLKKFISVNYKVFEPEIVNISQKDGRVHAYRLYNDVSKMKFITTVGKDFNLTDIDFFKQEDIFWFEV